MEQAVFAARAEGVAVLAFANMSHDPENEYFSDGISEELLNVLAKVPGLRVTARTSAFFFKGKNVSVPEIAWQLGVTHVVEGSVRKAASRVRITAQLIEAKNGFHLWSDTFDRELKDIFAVQDEIAGLIAEKLSLKMGLAKPAEKTVDPEVLRLYFEARQIWNIISDQSLAQMEHVLTHALKLDPNFAPAEAGLAEVWVIRAFLKTGAARYCATELANATDHATKALGLAPTSSEAFVALGTAALLRGELACAESAITRAVALNPNYLVGWQRWGWLLARQGRLDGALGPAATRYKAGWALVALGRNQEAYAALLDTPQQLISYLWFLVQRHETLAADPRFLNLLGQLNAAAGLHAARETLARRQREPAGQP